MPNPTITIKEAIAIVLEELHIRLPKTSQEGFLAEPQVYEAVARLLEYINKYKYMIIKSCFKSGR